MKRLLLALMALGGGAYWWVRRARQRADAWRPPAPGGSAPGPAEAATGGEPPLGGEVDPDLVALLACPADHQPVEHVGSFLVCQACQRHYPVRDGIPSMIVEDALTPEQARALESPQA